MAPLKKLMSNEDFNAIFSNIEVIRQFSQRLCQDLEKRWQNWSDTQKIGDIFVEMVCAITLSFMLLIDH